MAMNVSKGRLLARRLGEKAPRPFVGTEIFTQAEIRLELPEGVLRNRRLFGPIEGECWKNSALSLRGQFIRPLENPALRGLVIGLL